MATTNAVSTNTYKAATDFAVEDLGKLVRISAADTVSIVDAVTQTPIGVLAEAPAKAGQAVPVARLQGIIKVRAGGAVTAGQLAVPAADGRVTGVADINSIPADTMSVGVFNAGGAAGDLIALNAQPVGGNTSA